MQALLMSRRNLLDIERDDQKGGECGSCIVLMMLKQNHLIVIIKKWENVNV